MYTYNNGTWMGVTWKTWKPSNCERSVRYGKVVLPTIAYMLLASTCLFMSCCGFAFWSKIRGFGVLKRSDGAIARNSRCGCRRAER